MGSDEKPGMQEMPGEAGRLQGPAGVRDLQAILTGGLLMVQVKSVSDLRKQPFWKAGFRRAIQVGACLCHIPNTGLRKLACTLIKLKTVMPWQL